MKKMFRKIHVYLSLFFVPMALLYAISGIAYLSGIKENIGAEISKIIVPVPFNSNRAVEIITQTLDSKQIKLPSNLHTREAKGGGIAVGGIDYEVIARPKEEQTLVSVTKRTLLGDMIMLHKGKGAWYFNILSFGFGGALVLFYLTGLVMSWNYKEKNKKLFCITLGSVVTLTLGYLSVI